MHSYPRDEFDDIPEDSQRRGAYRGERIDRSTSRLGTLAIVMAGLAGLLIGAFMFVIQPRTLAPGGENQVSAAVSPASSDTSSPQAEEEKKPEDIKVRIFNAGAYPGAASQVDKELRAEGYQVVSSGNWDGESLPYSMVYYSNGFIAEANTVTDGLGLSYFEEKKDLEADISVVLGPEFAGIEAGSFEDNVKAQESAQASESPSP